MAAVGKDGAIGTAGQQAEGLASDMAGRYAVPGPANPAALRDHLRKEGGAGKALDGPLRKKIAGPLGADPQTARIHTGPAAAEAARQMQASAFTIGQDVFFAANKFDPTTAKGAALLAHEATHVVQQTGGHRSDARFYTPKGGDEMEQEAQDVAELVLRNAGAAGNLVVQVYERQYQGEDDKGVTPADRQRLDRISMIALEEVKRRARSQGLGPGTVEEILVALTLDLANLTDEEAASQWADAIMAELVGAEHAPIQTHASGATGRAHEAQISQSPGHVTRTNWQVQRDPAPAAASNSVVFYGNRFTNEDAQLDAMLRQYMVDHGYKETESLVYRFDMASQGHKPTPALSTATVKDIAAKANAAFKRLQTLSNTLVDAFTKELLSTVGGMLDKSSEQIRAEAFRYGIDPDRPSIANLPAFGINIPGITSSPVAEDMGKAAKRILDVTKRRKEIHKLYSLGTSMPPPGPLDIDVEYHQTTAELVSKHPILSYYLKNEEKLTELANEKDPRETLRREIDEKLTNIAVVRGDLADRKDNLWLETRLNTSTRKRLNMQPGSFENAVVDEQVKFIKEDRIFIEHLKHAIGIGLTILAFVPGAQVIAVAGGVAMGGVGVYSAFQDYMWESAAAGTSFDRALVISQSEPSLIGLGVAIAAGMAQGIVEAKAIEMAIGSFKVLAPALRQALALRRISTVERTPHSVKLADAAVEDLRVMADKEQPGLGTRLKQDVDADRVLEQAGPAKPSGVDPDADPPTLRDPPSTGPDSDPPTLRTPQKFNLPPVTTPPRWRPGDLPGVASKSGAGAEMVAIQAKYKVKVAPSPKKGMSYFDESTNTTYIDPGKNLNEAALDYVHEMGHAKLHHEKMTPGSEWTKMPRELYVNIMLHEEAMVQIRAIRAQRDLMLNQPGFTGDTLFAAEYNRVARAAFDEYIKANPGEYIPAQKVAFEAADQHIFNLYQNGTQVINSITKEPYQIYYGRAWDEAQPGAVPKKAPAAEPPPGGGVPEAPPKAPGTPELQGGGGGPAGPGGPMVRKGPIPDQQPANIYESITMDEARAGAGEIVMRDLGDTPRLVDNYGEGEWVKMHHSHTTPDGKGIAIHWFRNLTNGKNVEFKFKQGAVLNASR